MNKHITTLHFTTDGRMHCDGLAPVLRSLGLPGTKPVHLGAAEPGAIGCDSCPRFIKCGMSHTAQVQTQMTDTNAIIAACKEMGLPVPVHNSLHFGGTKNTGLCVQLPEWRYPVVIDTATGKVSYDNYGGSWGKQEHLQKFTQMYGVAKATAIAKAKGYMINRTTLPNGTIRLNVTGV